MSNEVVTAQELNTLPDKIRSYIHNLETESDPAGTIRQNILVREENEMLRRHIATEQSAYAELAAERDALRTAGLYTANRLAEAESQLAELRKRVEVNESFSAFLGLSIIVLVVLIAVGMALDRVPF